MSDVKRTKLRKAGVLMADREVADALLVGRKVLVIWHQAHAAEVMQPVLEGLRARSGSGGQVMMEHAERLSLGEMVL